jgi:hypothetical protein
MHKNERLFKEHLESPFYICKLDKAFLKHDGETTIIEAFLNSKNILMNLALDQFGMSTNPWIKTLTARQNPSAAFLTEKQKLFAEGTDVQIANEENPVRWVGSGALVILETSDGQKYAILNKRHKKYTWADYYDANGGYSSSDGDMIRPDFLAKREVAEELLFVQNDIPLPIELLDPEIIQPKKPVTAIVHYKGQAVRTNNLILIIDKETGTIDFRQILKIKLPNLINLFITDREDMFVDKTNKASQGRPILLVPLNGLVEVIKKDMTLIPFRVFATSGDVNPYNYKITNNLLTPALRSILQNI